MRSEDPESLPYVPLRPYSAEYAAAEQRQQAQASSSTKPRAFQPTLPSERKAVEQVLLASVPAEATAESLLRAAWRSQDNNVDVGHRKFVPFQGLTLDKFGISAGTAGQASLHHVGPGGVTAPRKAKVRTEGKSQDLRDLAFTCNQKIVDGQVKSNYTPLSLPYFDVLDEDHHHLGNAGGEAGGTSSSSKRPAMLHVDEANANAAKELFLNPGGALQEDQLLLMQLPAILPELADPLEEVQREKEDAATAGAGASITRFPDGKLGKLRIYKSGKVRMEIGGIEFCVDQGCDTFFQQDLACVCPLAREVINLGPIQKRIVLTPDFESLFDRADPKASSDALRMKQTGLDGGVIDALGRSSGDAGGAQPWEGAESQTRSE